MKSYLILYVFCLLSVSGSAQTEVNFGYTFGRNRYIDSQQDNISTMFNLGWDYDKSNAGYLVGFVPSPTEYTINNRMNWNRTTRGMLLGFGFNMDDDVSFELNFVGCTNKSFGSRQNIATNITESLTLKTKFGGVQFLTLFNLHERFSINVGMGVNLFRTRFSWSGETDIKNQTIGTRVNPLSQEVKDGDRDLTLTFPLGFTARLLYLEESDISIKARFNYIIVWNEMVQTDLLNYLPYSYNLNSTTLSIILSKTL